MSGASWSLLLALNFYRFPNKTAEEKFLMSQEEKKRNKWQKKMLRNFGKNQRPLLTVGRGRGRGSATDRLGGSRGAAEWAPGRLKNFADFLTRRPGRRQQAQAKTLKILFDTLAAAADVAVAVAVLVV